MAVYLSPNAARLALVAQLAKLDIEHQAESRRNLMAEPMGGAPFLEGLDAFGRGVARQDCPYPPGSEEAEEWEEGWDEGNRLDEEGEPKDDA